MILTAGIILSIHLCLCSCLYCSAMVPTYVCAYVLLVNFLVFTMSTSCPSLKRIAHQNCANMWLGSTGYADCVYCSPVRGTHFTYRVLFEPS